MSAAIAAAQRRRLDDVPPQPWRNGGGLTRELLAWPDGPDWLVRVSVADVDADGRFSAFAGVERWFAVLQGAGVVLSFADGDRRVDADCEPLRFDGAAAPGCRLVAGPTRDLNLMLRGGARGVLRRAGDGEAWDEAWRWRACYVQGAARCLGPDGLGVDLDAGTLLCGLPPGPCRLAPRGAAAPSFWLGADVAMEPLR